MGDVQELVYRLIVEANKAIAPPTWWESLVYSGTFWAALAAVASFLTAGAAYLSVRVAGKSVRQQLLRDVEKDYVNWLGSLNPSSKRLGDLSELEWQKRQDVFVARVRILDPVNTVPSAEVWEILECFIAWCWVRHGGVRLFKRRRTRRLIRQGAKRYEEWVKQEKLLWRPGRPEDIPLDGRKSTVEEILSQFTHTPTSPPPK